jgi:hypothetical protein
MRKESLLETGIISGRESHEEIEVLFVVAGDYTSPGRLLQRLR